MKASHRFVQETFVSEKRESTAAIHDTFNHFDFVYLTVEQQKDCGRFSVCIYRLNDVVEPGPAPARPSRAKKAASGKLCHGENGINISVPEDRGEPEARISEKLLLGGKLPENSIGVSEKPISENLRYEKTVSQNFGQPYINNISTRNSYFMKEQVNDHQRRPRRPVEMEPLTLFSSANVKQRIGYDRLKAEAEGWGKLMKNTLGSLNNPEDERRYYQTMEGILRARQTHECDFRPKAHGGVILKGL